MTTCWIATSSALAAGKAGGVALLQDHVAAVRPRAPACGPRASTASLRSTDFIATSRSTTSRRTRRTTSLARRSSRRMSARICRTSSIWVGSGLQQHLGDLRVGQDRAERLVDLVRDRRRQLADRRQAAGMRELPSPLAAVRLGVAALPAGYEQRHDQRRLESERDRHGDDPSAIQHPERRRVEAPLDPLRHPVHRYAESLELSRVDGEEGPRSGPGGYGGGARALENAKHELARLAALGLEVVERPADDSVAEVRGVQPVDRNRRRGGQPLEELSRDPHAPVPRRGART